MYISLLLYPIIPMVEEPYIGFPKISSILLRSVPGFILFTTDLLYCFVKTILKTFLYTVLISNPFSVKIS